MKKNRISILVYIGASILLLLLLHYCDFSGNPDRNFAIYLMKISLWPLSMAIYPVIFFRSYGDTIKFSLIAGIAHAIVWVLISVHPSQASFWSVMVADFIYMLFGLGLAIALMSSKKAIKHYLRK